MRIVIALFALLSVTGSTATGEEEGWKTDGPWMDMVSGHMIGTDRLHVPQPDLPETTPIAVNAICSESSDRRYVTCDFIDLGIAGLSDSKECGAWVEFARRILRVTERSRSHIVWFGTHTNPLSGSNTTYRLAVTFNPKGIHLSGMPELDAKWEYTSVRLYPDRPMWGDSLSRSQSAVDSTARASSGVSDTNFPAYTKFAVPCRPTAVFIQRLK
jgi:hypothetical protein